MTQSSAGMLRRRQLQHGRKLSHFIFRLELHVHGNNDSDYNDDVDGEYGRKIDWDEADGGLTKEHMQPVHVWRSSGWEQH